MNRSRIAWALFIVASLAAAAYVCLHGAKLPVLEPDGPIALGERSVIIVTVLLSSIVVIPVFVLLFWFAWNYRATNPETMKHHRPEWDHSNPYFEFAWWLVPSAIIAVLAVVAWQSSHALDPYEPIAGAGAPITIEVVALDWKWLFIYPEQKIATVNEVLFPVGSPVRFVLTADAPMNSFWIPALAGQIMVMPGMTTQLNVLASKAADYDGMSGNLSGAGFAGMRFKARAVSADNFAAWIDAVRRSSVALSRQEYESLKQPSANAPVATYSSIDENLYTAVTMKYMAGTFIPERESSTQFATASPELPAATSSPVSDMPDDMQGMKGMPMAAPTLQ